MFKILKIDRNQIYYVKKEKTDETGLESKILKIFNESRKNYASRKIRAKLQEEKIFISKKRILKIMKKLSLISKYSIRKYKKSKTKVNKDEVPNILARNFKNRKSMEVVVSNLTYIDISGRWNYICILPELSSIEIIGFSTSKNKDANLVEKAFYSVKYNLYDIESFHTDRRSEFKNDHFTTLFEFIKGNTFESLEILETLLFDYVNWYNNFRIHSSLDYKTPMEFKYQLQNELS